MTKEEFILQYILARANNPNLILKAAAVVEAASMFWDLVYPKPAPIQHSLATITPKKIFRTPVELLYHEYRKRHANLAGEDSVTLMKHDLKKRWKAGEDVYMVLDQRQLPGIVSIAEALIPFVHRYTILDKQGLVLSVHEPKQDRT